jgi:hypothetical protein
MINLKKWALLGVIIVLGLFVGVKDCRKHQQAKDKVASSPILQPDQKVKVIVDSHNHTIEVITPTSDKKGFLPEGPVDIIENKDNKIVFNRRVWGYEMYPFAAVGVDNKVRLHLGMDLFYVYRFDMGIGLGVNPSNYKDISPNLNISYNIWSNSSLGVSYNNHGAIGGILKLRF